MAVRKTIVLAALSFLFTLRAAEPLPQWEIVELGLPTNSPSAAVDVNERNDVIGVVGGLGAEQGFLWRGGDRWLTILGGFERTFPKDINNNGVIVGSSTSNGVMRAWAWSNEVNLDLSFEMVGATVASAINDHGEIIGSRHISTYPEFYRLSAQPVRLTPDLILPLDVDGPPAGGGVHGLNNNGAVVGQWFGQAIVRTNWPEKTWPEFLRPSAFGGVNGESAALAINSSNQMAGFLRTHTTEKQPAVWLTNRWTTLPSSLEASALAEGINDSALVVGTARSSATAMIWKDGAGADLNAFVDVPPESRLTAAVAVNNAGFIAATLVEKETSRAVLLKRVRDGVIPKLEVVGPDGAVLRTNKVNVTINTPYNGTAARTVTYRLYERLHTEGYDGMASFKTYKTRPVRTTLASGDFISASFENLPAAQYLVSAELNDTNGVTLYSTPIAFVVTEPPRLRPYRVSWAGDFQFTMSPTPGQSYALEESTNFVTWTRVEVAIQSGGGFSREATNAPLKFYRTVAVSEGTSVDSREEAKIKEAPVSLGPRGARITLMDPFWWDIALAADGTFFAESHNPGTVVGQGRYTYRPGLYVAYVTLEDPSRSFRGNLEVEFPLDIPAPNGAVYFPRVRGTITRHEEPTQVLGFFLVE